MFNRPAAPVSDRLGDYLDRPVLIRPKEYRALDTQLGRTMALYSDVIVPTPEKGSGAYFNLGEVPIFWKGVQLQLEDSGIGEWCGGRLHLGRGNNTKAYVLLDPTDEDVEILEAVLGSLKEY